MEPPARGVAAICDMWKVKGFGTVPSGLSGTTALAAGGSVENHGTKSVCRMCMLDGSVTRREDIQLFRWNMIECRCVNLEVFSEYLFGYVGCPICQLES